MSRPDAPRRVGRPSKRTAGRTPGGRERILAAAQELIASGGLRGVSVRDVARRAGVDPALLYTYYRNKEALFLAALSRSFTLLRADRRADGLSFEGLGERIVLRFARTWGSPRTRPMFLTVVRAAAEDPRAARQFRAFVEETIIPATRADLGSMAPTRSTMVGSVLLGMAVLRYIVRARPIASQSDEELARLFGPLVSALLAGGFDPAPARPGAP